MQQKTHIGFDRQLASLIQANLQGFSVKNHESNGHRRAAVAVTVVSRGGTDSALGIARGPSDQAALVLTRRSSRLRKHGGQWAFPGGRIDEGESAEQAALRELYEEVGLSLGSDAVLGRLDDFSTRSGFTISPIVLWGGADPVFQPNYDEVASIHRIPLDEIMRDDAPLLQHIPESDNPVLLMPIGDGWIATPTGAIIYQFREVAIKGNAIRVDHYEQPYFAWQ